MLPSRLRDLSRSQLRRRLPLVALAALVLAAIAIAPALGGGKPLTKKQAKRLFAPLGSSFTKAEADSRFAPSGAAYTKGEADARFLGKGEADARFLGSSGDIRLSVPHIGWEVYGANLHTVSYTEEAATFSSPGMSTGGALLPLEFPTQQFGRAMRIAGVEYCYDTQVSSALTNVRLRRQQATPGDPVAAPTNLAQDATDRTDSTCRTLSVPGDPVAAGPNDTLHLEFVVDYPAAGSIRFSRTTLILSP